MTILKLIASALFPVILAVTMYIVDKKTKFNKLPYIAKQIIFGIIFGISACLATEFGIPTVGVVLNVRGASPLTAGLLFGGPAGIIAGVIGGVYRWLSVMWGIGSYTRIACSLGTIFAGIIGAICRKFMFDNKKTSWLYGLFIGVSTEVLHMLLVFVTHMDDIEKAFEVVLACAIPMIVANGLSVMTAVLIISIIGKERSVIKNKTKKQITQTFSRALFICVIIAFIVTSLFTLVLQDRVSYAELTNELSISITDVENDITNASDANLLSITRRVAGDVLKLKLYEVTVDTVGEERENRREELISFTEKYNVSEINLVDKNGDIVLSTNSDFDFFNMNSNISGQAKEFMCLLGDTQEYVQKYGPIDNDPNIYRKYAGYKLSDDMFVQVGYDSDHFQSTLAEKVNLVAQNRHIGNSGYTFILRENTYTIMSAPSECISQADIISNISLIDSVEDFKVTETINAESEKMYIMQEHCEGYIIVSCMPESEAHFGRNISVYVGVFMQIVVFVSLFVLIYIMIKRIIVDNIHKINGSLAKIANGNLNTTVNVRDNEEFSSFSDDINSTVSTLKDYIAEAETRVQKELEFAQTIQNSSLPSVFPPYPNRREFDIFATMNTAKEVGGDFYDFYFVGDNKLLILIADVSGKGIPAAMFMMTAKTMIKNLAETGIPIEEIMTEANEKLCEMNEAGMFVTVWAGIIDLTSGKLNYVSAGHNPPLIKHQTGEFDYLRGRNGLVLAGMDGVRYKVNEVQLLPNDKIYLYTDGVTEATNASNELYGEDRLKDYLNSRDSYDVTETCNGVLEDVNKFVDGAPQFDDITMLMFSLNEINNYNELTLAPTVESIPRVTEFFENWMLRTKVDQKIVRKVNVIVDEIYSNIAHYSGSLWAKVHYTRDIENLYLTFTDNGKEYNPLEAEDPDITLSAEEREIGGLGIMMVKKMASDINYSYIDGQNVLKITISIK